MLLVETYLDRSEVSGIGVFAQRDIAVGTCIWVAHESVDMRFSPQQWEEWLRSISEAIRPDMRRHSYKQDGHVVLCLDHARFMNHGGERSNIRNDASSDSMFARWDIAAGSELLCDYREYSDSDDLHLSQLDC